MTAVDAEAPSVVERYCAVAYTHYRSDPRVRREAEAMRDRGAHVTVIALGASGRATTDEVGGVTVIGLPVERYRGDGLRNYVRSYASFFTRAAVLLSRRPRLFDLIHVHSLPEAMVFAALVPKLAGCPVVLDVHDLSSEVMASRRGSAPRAVRFAERMSLRFADRVVTVHDQYRDKIVARGVRPASIQVVLNTPDDQLFPLLAPVAPARPPRLIHHGTLVERYGLQVALEAVAQVQRTVPGCELTIVGDGDDRPTIERRRTELGLDDIVQLSDGMVPIDEIPAMIRLADVGIVPFTDDPFTRSILPTKLIEYVRMGRPTIVSRNAVIESYFDDEQVYFVEPGNVGDIVAAIESIDADPAEAARRATNAQRFFDTEGWPMARERLWSLFDEVVRAA